MSTVLDPPKTGGANSTGSSNSGPTHPDGPGEDSEREAAAKPEEFVVEGNGQLSLTVGGKRPTGAALRIVGGRIEVNGSFDKGEVVRVELVLRVDEVSFVDDVDPQTKQVVGCERRHKARMISPPRILSNSTD